jgi:hypothetical protein
VTLNGDTTPESDETFFANLSGVSGPGVTVVDDQAEVTILNDDVQELINGVAVTGLAGATGTQTNFIMNVPAGATNLAFTTSGGTGDADLYVRFGSAPTTTVYDCRGFLSGNNDSCSFPSPSAGTYYVMLNAYSTYSGAQIVGSYTPPPVSLSISDVSKAEGNSGTTVVTFTVSLSAVSASPVTYDIATGNNTASSASDYVAKSLIGETIPAGQLSRTFTVNVNGDTTVEANESFKVNLSNPGGATILDGSANGHILNDDGAALTINDLSIQEGNSGTKVATFTVRLLAASASNVSFDIATGGGTATAGVDYVAKSLIGEIIPAGQLSKTFTVTIKGDLAREQNETFKATLSNVTNATLLRIQGQVTVLNDDGPLLTVSNASVSEGNSGTKVMTFTINLVRPSTLPVTYNIGTVSETATATVDYVGKNLLGETIPAGMLSKTFTVTIKGDVTVEANETFSVRLSQATGGATILDGYGQGTITNDD